MRLNVSLRALEIDRSMSVLGAQSGRLSTWPKVAPLKAPEASSSGTNFVTGSSSLSYPLATAISPNMQAKDFVTDIIW
ncbi:hypothetical protein [Roseibium sp.]|uniref:hypothetical protein n=1 Tax=Roseibium sp. TaxID=1936156 RepID=UPI003B507D34